MQTVADYFDGQSSRQYRVMLSLNADNLLNIQSQDISVSFPMAECEFSPRIANIPREITLPNQAKLVVADNDFLDDMLETAGMLEHGFVHRLEQHWRFAFVSLVILVASVWAAIDIGIPVAAKQAAFALPYETDVYLGEGALATLDKIVFSPSTLKTERQQALKQRFQEMVKNINDTSHQYQLELRDGKAIGANALALPSGIIVMTDQLVDLSEADDELAAILAHELGHVKNRHALRLLIQDAVGGLVLAMLTGDAVSATALTAGLPTLFLHNKFSREFENEADTFALQYMSENDIPAENFATIMNRLDDTAGKTSDLDNYLSTHPATADRIKRFQSPASK